MKKVLIAFVIALLMILSYAAGRRHTAQPAAASTNTRRVLYWVDPMHPDYKSDHPGIAPDCGMQLEPVYADAAGHAASSAPGAQSAPGGVVIDGATQSLLGIQVATVQRGGAPQVIRVTGRVVPEDTRVYRINSGMEGFIRETFNDSVGVRVKKDQRLATFYGPDALAVASGFLAASKNVPGAVGKDGSRTVPFPGTLHKQGVSSLEGYADRLRNLGFSDVQLKEMAETGQLPESIDIVAPADGFILARQVTPGQHFDHATEFYRIADLSRVWILADLLGSEAQNFRPGATARIILSDRGKTFSARVSDILPEVDPATRTLKLRLEADNPAFALRPDMFVDVELAVPMQAGLTVPRDAVIDSGREQRVFVERSNGVFEPRPVETGWRSGDRIEIVRGLAEGERVVASGTFLVDSESRLKSLAQPPSKRDSDQGQNVGANSNTKPASEASAGKVKDAACGMMIDASKALAEGNTITRDGVTYYFCSDRCKKKFVGQPELAANPSGHRS